MSQSNPCSIRSCGWCRPKRKNSAVWLIALVIFYLALAWLTRGSQARAEYQAGEIPALYVEELP